MRFLTVGRTIDADPERVWDVLIDVDAWPSWGPSLRAARLDDGGRRLTAGATGRVTTVGGVEVPFSVTDYEDGVSWAWDVGRVTATTHRIAPAAGGGAEVTFGVPWWAPPYLVVCELALRRIERLVIG